jgi:hypothetical protein
MLSGSTPFSKPAAGIQPALSAIVDYAVYAPTTFSTSAALGLPADISGGTEYIYAYQMFNTGVPGNAYITQLSVGLYAGAVSNFATLVSHLSGTPLAGMSPNAWNFNSSTLGNPKVNVYWQFNPSGQLPVGQASDILVFASPNPPSFKSSGISAQMAVGATNLLPSPVPEPATIVLAGSAAVGLLVVQKLRRRRRW